MDRFTKHWGNNPPVPTGFNQDFILDMEPEQLEGYNALLQRLSDYEDIGMEPEEIIRFLALFYHMADLLQEKRDQAVLEKIKHLGGIAQPSQFTWDKPADNAGYVAEARYDTVLF